VNNVISRIPSEGLRFRKPDIRQERKSIGVYGKIDMYCFVMLFSRDHRVIELRKHFTFTSSVQVAMASKAHPKVKFTPEEDFLLKRFVMHFEAAKWNRASSFIPRRSARQCRER
jgi:hypothetical protein